MQINLKLFVVLSLFYTIRYSLCVTMSRRLTTSFANTTNMNSENKSTVFHNKSLDCNSINLISIPTATFLAVYESAVAKLNCGLKANEITWVYSKSLLNISFSQTVQTDRMTVYNNLTIYRVTKEEAGVYRCQSKDTHSGFMVLEVVDDDTYENVAYNSKIREQMCNSVEGFKACIVWSPWSECSVCGRVGKKRRYGMCYVTLDKNAKKHDFNISTNIRQLFQALPKGIPCRSLYLPDELHNISLIRNTSNKIMIAKCKVPCKITIFELRSPNGTLVETANNTAGVYSLRQRIPPQPPPPARDIVFVGRGQPILVKCLGTTLRDIPVTWRVGSTLVIPKVLSETSGGRIFADARDRIVIREVVYEDANMYSCWEGENLVGTTKLVVWGGGQPTWDQHTVSVVLLSCSATLFQIALKVLESFK